MEFPVHLEATCPSRGIDAVGHPVELDRVPQPGQVICTESPDGLPHLGQVITRGSELWIESEKGQVERHAHH